MFFDPRGGSDEHEPFPTDAASAVGVRNLGLSIHGGMWALPAFAPELQTANLDVSISGKLLAGFSLAAHSRGLPLPKQPFTTLLDALNAQFNSYLRAQTGDTELLPMSLRFVMEDQSLHMIGYPSQNLPVIKLRQVVEEINAVCPGLGWYIPQTIARSHAAALPVYDPCRMRSIAEFMWFSGAESDEEMILELYGEEVTDENRGSLTEMLHEENAYTPSMWSQSMGGNPELWASAKPSTSASFDRKLRMVMGTDTVSETARTALQQARDFNRLLKKQKPFGFDFNKDLPEDSGDQIGALAFVVWDDTGLPLELIHHFETSAYEGDAYEETLHCTFDLSDRMQWPHTIDAIKAYVARFVSFSKLLSTLEQKDFQNGD